MHLALNSVGLLLDICGVWLLFCFGFRGDAALEHVITDTELVSKSNRRLALTGVVLLTLGFGLQIVSQFLQYSLLEH